MNVLLARSSERGINSFFKYLYCQRAPRKIGRANTISAISLKTNMCICPNYQCNAIVCNIGASCKYLILYSEYVNHTHTHTVIIEYIMTVQRDLNFHSGQAGESGIDLLRAENVSGQRAASYRRKRGNTARVSQSREIERRIATSCPSINFERTLI